MGKWWSLLFAVMMILCGGLFVVAPFLGWWLPDGVSTHAHLVDRLFYFILAITGFFFVITELILCVFMSKYAADRAPASEQPTGPSFFARLFRPVTSILNDQHKVEMAWTIVPAVILLYIAFAQVDTWATAKYQSRMPTSKQTPQQVFLSARQFEWRFRYPSSERFQDWIKRKDTAEVASDYISFAKYEQQDDVHLVNELHVMKDNPVVVHLTTRDVIHSFNLPHLRVKQDALPGKMIPLWFTPTESNVKFDGNTYTDGYRWIPDKGEAAKASQRGRYAKDDHYIWDLACAELCGWGHYRMVGRLFVHKDEAEFLDWLKKAEAENHARKREK